MRESQSSPNLVHPRHNSSLRLKKKRNEVKKDFFKSRMSGEYGYNHSNAAVDMTENNSDDKLATLDAGPTGAGLQHKLRPLLRSRYGQDMKITEYGLIDRHTPGNSGSEGRWVIVSVLTINNNIIHMCREELDNPSSLNCFSLSTGSTMLEVREHF